MFAGQRPQPLSLKRANMSNDLWSEPSSPATTFSSLSWAAEKSAAELAGLLKNAHASLREKEKDLTLAAELGHYLLENNAALKSQYESLLQQQNQQDENSNVVGDGDDHLHNERNLLLLSQQKAHQLALGELQDKNMELQRLLQDAQQESDKLQLVHDRKARELEHDITLLKDHLDLAAQQIEEMEEDRQYKSMRQRQQQHPCKQRRYQYPHQNDLDEYNEERQQHDSVLNDLQTKIRQLENENNQLVHTRQSVQERLDRALHDVDALQHQFKLGQWTRDGYTKLNDAYQRQFSHIAQLNVSLEEHRHTLINLVEHGVLGNMNDNSRSILALSHSSSSAATTLKSSNGPFPSCHTTAPTVENNNNLMTELEKAWHRNITPDIGTTTQHWRIEDDVNDDDDGYSSLPDGFKQQQQSACFTDTSCFYLSSTQTPPAFLDDNDDDDCNYYSDNIMNKYDDDGNNKDDDLFGPLDATDIKTSYNLYPDMISKSTCAYSSGLLVAGQPKEHQEW
ncbi:unnamed protein product [Absidia cylindrospora]